MFSSDECRRMRWWKEVKLQVSAVPGTRSTTRGRSTSSLLVLVLFTATTHLVTSKHDQSISELPINHSTNLQ